MDTDTFQETVWQAGRDYFRPMPWRETTDPYAITLSELMLQQTQVDRVVPKYQQFLERFPDVRSLAAAPLSDVLAVWVGLGYNRRAQYVHRLAKQIVECHGGVFPDSYDALVELPGIGPNTAGAILAYAFNQPAVFIETNVRSVYFQHFFPDDMAVDDKSLRDIVAQTVDREHPREWYWALMDYGATLKKAGAGRISQSRHYKKQPPLEGSRRQVRGAIIRQLQAGPVSETNLRRQLQADDRFAPALEGLISDGLVSRHGRRIQLSR